MYRDIVLRLIHRHSIQLSVRPVCQRILFRTSFRPCFASSSKDRSVSTTCSSSFLVNNAQSFSVQVRNYAKGAIVKDKKTKGGKPKVLLSDEQLKEVLDPASLDYYMKEAIDKLKADYIKNIVVRSSGGIEKLPVLIEGEEFPLNEIAQLFRKNPQLVVINMTNFPEGLKPVLDALQNSGMNINPQQDGTMIYVQLPKVTREHRQALAVNAKASLNKTKDDLRTVQNTFIKHIKKKQDDVSSDLIFNATEYIRYTCEKYGQEAEKVFQIKEKELLGE